MFLEHHLPRNFFFPDDPSHLKAGEARRFLEFIRDRQKNCPEDVFAFRYTLNRFEELVAPVDTSDEEHEAHRVRESKRAKKPKAARYMNVEDDEAEERPDNLPNKIQPRPVLPRDATTQVYPQTESSDNNAEGSEQDLEGDPDIHRRKFIDHGPARHSIGNAGNDRPRHSDEEISDIGEEARRKWVKGKGKEILKEKSAVVGKKQAHPAGPLRHVNRGQAPSTQTSDGPSSRGSAAEIQPRYGDSSAHPGKEVTFSEWHNMSIVSHLMFKAKGTVGPAHSNGGSLGSAPNANGGRRTVSK